MQVDVSSHKFGSRIGSKATGTRFLWENTPCLSHFFCLSIFFFPENMSLLTHTHTHNTVKSKPWEHQIPMQFISSHWPWYSMQMWECSQFQKIRARTVKKFAKIWPLSSTQAKKNKAFRWCICVCVYNTDYTLNLPNLTSLNLVVSLFKLLTISLQ